MNDRDGKKPQIIIICGPTGIGKTATAITLASAFSGEIINADSMQIYRQMNIGTAKPTPEETTRVTHHLIDIVDPDEAYDAAAFEQAAHRRIQGLCRRRIRPFVVGGTGFYIKALIYGLCEAIPTDPAIRNRLREEASNTGAPALHKRLSACDPEIADKIHPNDAFRIIRALEVFEITGRPLSSHQQAHRFRNPAFRQLKIGLHMDRAALYERIDRRVDAMIAAGLLEEVQALLNQGYPTSLKSMQSIGYRHMGDYIEGRLSWEEALRTLKRDTRRYAKRQMTWFGADAGIHWMRPDEIDAMHALIHSFFDEE